MAVARHYDTVAFDVRDNAAMLFFAVTEASGDIRHYLLLMRADGSEPGETLYIEIDESQLAGEDVVTEATLNANVVSLKLNSQAAETFGTDELIVTFDDTRENWAGIEAGALRVLGDKLTGGHS